MSDSVPPVVQQAAVDPPPEHQDAPGEQQEQRQTLDQELEAFAAAPIGSADAASQHDDEQSLVGSGDGEARSDAEGTAEALAAFQATRVAELAQRKREIKSKKVKERPARDASETPSLELGISKDTMPMIACCNRCLQYLNDDIKDIDDNCT